MTDYVDSKGQRKPIREMAYPHLKSARAKLGREPRDATRYATDEALTITLAAMDDEIAKRDAEFAAQQAQAGPAE